MKQTPWITIEGQVPSKSNCYKVGKFGSRCGIYKAKNLKEYEKDFYFQLPSDLPLFENEFQIVVNVFFPNKRQDLDNSSKVILDCLQDAGVIKNDNKCTGYLAHRFIDKENPRIEFKIFE